MLRPEVFPLCFLEEEIHPAFKLNAAPQCLDLGQPCSSTEVLARNREWQAGGRRWCWLCCPSSAGLAETSLSFVLVPLLRLSYRAAWWSKVRLSLSILLYHLDGDQTLLAEGWAAMVADTLWATGETVHQMPVSLSPNICAANLLPTWDLRSRDLSL